MIVGESGSGKTTLLNFVINYIMGVKFEDNFRYTLVNDIDKHCRTSEVNVYNIKPNKLTQPLRLIDTPGFGYLGVE